MGTRRQKIGIIGLGLIGGSIALALKDKYEIKGCDNDPAVAEYARANGFCAVSEPSGMTDCAAVFVCVPVDRTEKVLRDAAKALGNATVITDVCSVKQPFAMLSSECRYVGGHPMAGVERGGIEHARKNLFKDAYWVITGDADADTVSGIVSDTGARVLKLAAAEHDRAVSVYSHAPHAVAYALVAAANNSRVPPIAGSGFLDTTRIAQSDENFWTTVFEMNRANVVRDLDAVIGEIEKIKSMIERGAPELNGYVKNSRIVRTALNRVDLGGECVYVELEDKVGEFERVTGLIAKAGINLKNIALVPVRDGVAGALRLEFDTAADSARAVEILHSNDYAASVN